MFYLGMLGLTILSRPIHNASLPKVKIARPRKEQFTFDKIETKDGSASYTRDKSAYGIPRKIYDSGQIFVVVKEVINEEERNIARRVEGIEIGLSNDTSYEITEGLLTLKSLIVTGYEGIEDGDEVYVE